jgi:hypothetical protein
MERHDSHSDKKAGGASLPHSAGITAIAWGLALFGAIALFLGLFILFAGENQSVGLGGDLSWRVGDINAAWAYGLLAGGAVLLLGTLAIAVSRRRRA